MDPAQDKSGEMGKQHCNAELGDDSGAPERRWRNPAWRRTTSKRRPRNSRRTAGRGSSGGAWEEQGRRRPGATLARRCSVGERRNGETGGGRGGKAQRRRSSKKGAAPHRGKRRMAAAHRAGDQGARGVWHGRGSTADSQDGGDFPKTALPSCPYTGQQGHAQPSHMGRLSNYRPSCLTGPTSQAEHPHSLMQFHNKVPKLMFICMSEISSSSYLYLQP